MECFAAGSVTSVNMVAGKISGFSMFLYSFILLLFFVDMKKGHFFLGQVINFFKYNYLFSHKKKQSTCIQASFI